MLVQVGILIGYLQYHSRAKIQITRVANADPNSPTMPVEMIASLDNINNAEAYNCCHCRGFMLSEF